MGATLDATAKTSNRKSRSKYPTDFKRRLATNADTPGMSVSQLAHQHAINANMLFKWRRELRAAMFESTTPALLYVLLKSAATPAPARHTFLPSGMNEVVIGDEILASMSMLTLRHLHLF